MTVTTRAAWMAGIRDRFTPTDACARPSDGLVTFSIMWALALIFSVASHYENLTLDNGLRIAVIEYGVIGICIAVLLAPRHLGLLMALAGAMAFQYAYRLPVASNNQTIAFFMNLAIVTVLGMTWLRRSDRVAARDDAYEKLRIVARYLLAVMYFYGIFHKINTDFIDPNASCAVALYKPLVGLFGLEDNLIGRYGSIASTFILEAITLICLFWRRYFAIGLILGLVFHYVIPISAYSWYMDFSSLVFALYVLSVPREVSIAFYARSAELLRSFTTLRASRAAILLLVALLLTAIALSTALRASSAPFEVTEMMAWHSSWIVIWAVVGGVGMVVLCWAALESLPYQPVALPRQSAWLYLIPATLFLTCLSPYLGLKTESSIAMFSNLHTEGGTTNHLLFTKPVYMAPYQRDVALLEGSSHRSTQELVNRRLGVVRFELERRMRNNREDWFTFTMNGRRYERVTAATFPLERYDLLERRLLIFKPVDYTRPKACTH